MAYGETAPMYGDCVVRIKRAENGYTVTMRDPKIVAENAKSDRNKGPYSYIDPDREYVFDDKADMMSFLTANIDKALPDQKKTSFESTFDTLTDAPDDD